MIMEYYRKYKDYNISTSTKFLKHDIFNNEKKKVYRIDNISNYRPNYLRYCMSIRLIFPGDNSYTMCSRYITNFNAFSYMRKVFNPIDNIHSFGQIYMTNYKRSIKDYINT